MSSKNNRKFNIKSSGFFLICSIIFLALSFSSFAWRKTRVNWKESYKLKIPVEELFYIEKACIEYNTDFGEMLSCYLLENNYFLNSKTIKVSDFILNYSNIKVKYTDKKSRELFSLINGIYSEIECFPIDLSDNGAEYIYGDSFDARRTYGGERLHKGCDIMDRDNIRGRIKIVNMCDGEIEKLGWNEKGGWRVGVRSKNGNYYYYAHLSEYADGLFEGKDVLAGEILGYMGDSGYSRKEGTTGNFEVHLHMGIEVKKDEWINPYPFLRLIENKKGQ